LKKLFCLLSVFFKMMYLPYMQGPLYNSTVYAGLQPNIPVLNSFYAPTSSLPDCRSKTDDDLGSTISKSSSLVSSAVPTSMSGSNMEDESDSVRTNPIMGSNGPSDFHMDPVFVQAPVTEADGHVTCSPQHYQIFHTPVGPPIHVYENMLPYQPDQAPINTSMTCPPQFQQVLYPVQLQQRLAEAQNLSRVPTSTTVLSSQGDSMLYPQTSVAISGKISCSREASSNLFPNAVSTTPLVGSSMPGYVNSHCYVNFSAVQSNSCSAMSGIMHSSIGPTFHLGSNVIYRNIPDQMSYINTAPVSNVSSSESTYKLSKPYRADIENLWLGNGSYEEWNHNGGSNLFISWNGSESELVSKLQDYKLEVRNVFGCCDDGIFNVVFENHLNARKAFLMQREIRLRMVPPKDSRRHWLRNPSPKYLVKFETRCRLVVKKGKAEFHDIVGDLLMLNCQQEKGSIIWADQLKGHHIRVVSCEGNFMFPGGRVVQMKGVPTNSDQKKPLGWIRYRCRYTREPFVTRRSDNKLSDYIYIE